MQEIDENQKLRWRPRGEDDYTWLGEQAEIFKGLETTEFDVGGILEVLLDEMGNKRNEAKSHVNSFA